MTLTGGSTTTAVDSTRVNSSASAYKYDGCQIFVSNASGHVAPEGTWGHVTTGGFAGSTGTWTISPALTALASGMTALIFYDGLGYDDYFAAYNRIVGAHYWPRYIAMSQVTDGDMETSGVTNWTTIAGGTRVKTTTAAQVYTGTAALDLTVTASGDGIQSASVPVVPGYDNCYISVLLLLSDNTKSATVQLYDSSGAGTALGTAVTVNGSDWTEVRFQQSPGSTTENVYVRVKSSATGTWHIYLDYVQILTQNKPTIALPSQMAHAEDILAITFPEWSRSVGNYLYAPGPMNEIETPYGTFKDYAAVNPNRVQHVQPFGYPLFWKFLQKDAELSATAITALASTTFADLDAVVYGTAAELARVIAERPGISTTVADDWREKQFLWSRRYVRILDSIGMPQRRPSPVRAVSF